MIRKEALTVLAQRGQLFGDSNTNGQFSEFEIILMNEILADRMKKIDPNSDEWSDLVKFNSEKILELQ